MRNGFQFLLFSALLHVAFSLHQFVYVTLSTNWTSAQQFCRTLYTDLATFDDQEDYDQLLKIAGMGPMWIGLYRTTYPGEFVWSDQSSSSFRKWSKGVKTNQLCVKLNYGVWYDSNCTNIYPFACYIGHPKDGKTQIMKLEVKSSENLNDPEVMKKILLKMKQILMEKGLAEDAKLSWRIQSNGKVFQKDQKRDATEQICVS